ncbi:hypothetical protein SHKM778_81910 [Streptomyces sp. KM77-8]|uniref:PIN domain-containing protein n=1 Tax=Streptomyces haneummycinicus TaxID=3074435 RepID=A0AAT9HWD6_9ACTN
MPYPVLTEVCYLLEREHGTRAEAAFLRSVRTGQISLIPLAAQDIDRMVELVEKYADFPSVRSTPLSSPSPNDLARTPSPPSTAATSPSSALRPLLLHAAAVIG